MQQPAAVEDADDNSSAPSFCRRRKTTHTQNQTTKHKVPGGPRVEGAAFVSAKSPHVAPSVSLRLLSPQGDQMWSQTAVSNEVHFNVAARGPGGVSNRGEARPRGA